MFFTQGIFLHPALFDSAPLALRSLHSQRGLLWGHAQVFRTVPSAHTLVTIAERERLRRYSAASPLPQL